MLIIFLIAMVTDLFRPSFTAPECSKPPSAQNLESCCTFEKIADYEIVKKCSDLARSEPPPTGVSPEVCIAECIFNNTDIFVNGFLDINKVKQALQRKNKTAPEFMTIMERAFRVCDPKVKKDVNKRPAPTGPQTYRCRLYSGVLYLCLTNEVFINCPANKWRNSTECDNFRNYLKNCPLVK